MNRIPLAIVGAGGMGGRHLRALGALEESGMANVELVAVCDLREDNARHLADKAEALLGTRPEVFTSMETMRERRPDIAAVDITTDSGTHHTVAEAAFDLGFHVQCEKSLAMTIRGCNRVIEAWKRSGKVLSVAEQERRDPMCRLTKAVIDAGVHTGDQMMYYLGDIDEVFAVAKLWETKRYKGDRIGVADFYEHWVNEVPDEMDPDSEYMVISTLRFASGAVARWTSFFAVHGEPLGYAMIYGSRGSLRPAKQRRGDPLAFTIDGEGTFSVGEVLALVLDFHLYELSVRLFGGDRLGSYDAPFLDADRFLVALE